MHLWNITNWKKLKKMKLKHPLLLYVEFKMWRKKRWANFMKKRLFLTILILLVIAIIIVISANLYQKYITRQIYNECEPLGKAQHELYKDTIFKDFDFYESCVKNVICTSPLHKCPISNGESN